MRATYKSGLNALFYSNRGIHFVTRSDVKQWNECTAQENK